MSLQDPPWRQKTRPCPFFSQGRCLFADSCNFLHDIKVKSGLEQAIVDAQPVKPPLFSPPKTVSNPPSVVINFASPQLSSPTDDTSRYSGLLSVLQDVIGPTIHQEDDNFASQPVDSNDYFLHNPQDDSILADFSRSSPPNSRDSSRTSTLVDDSELCHDQDYCHSIVQSPPDLGDMQNIPIDHDTQEVGDDLLSPVALSARLRQFSFHDHSVSLKREDSIDSGYADSWTGPAMLARSPPYVSRNNMSFDSARFRPSSISSPPSRRVSYDVRAIRPSPRQSVVTEEHDNDPFPASSILEAYAFSSYDLDEEEESQSPTIRLTGMVSTHPLASHAFLETDTPLEEESLFSPFSSSTVCPPSAKMTSPTREVVLVNMNSGSLPPSPLPAPTASDNVHVDSQAGQAEHVVTPSSPSSSANESEVIEGVLSCKPSLLSLSKFQSGRSSPNTSIHMNLCSLPPSPASEIMPVGSRAEQVATPSSPSSSVNESEVIEGSCNTSPLSLGTFQSGCSSPNASIHMNPYSLPPSPDSEIMHVDSPAELVANSSSPSSSANEKSEGVEGVSSCKTSPLSSGAFQSGRSSPYTSILSAIGILPFQSSPLSTVEFVQRSRAVSDVTVKSDSFSRSVPHFSSSVVAPIPADFFDALDQNFRQPPDEYYEDEPSLEAPSVGDTVVGLALANSRPLGLTSHFPSAVAPVSADFVDALDQNHPDFMQLPDEYYVDEPSPEAPSVGDTVVGLALTNSRPLRLTPHFSPAVAPISADFVDALDQNHPDFMQLPDEYYVDEPSPEAPSVGDTVVGLALTNSRPLRLTPHFSPAVAPISADFDDALDQNHSDFLQPPDEYYVDEPSPEAPSVGDTGTGLALTNSRPLMLTPHFPPAVAIIPDNFVDALDQNHSDFLQLPDEYYVDEPSPEPPSVEYYVDEPSPEPPSVGCYVDEPSPEAPNVGDTVVGLALTKLRPLRLTPHFPPAVAPIPADFVDVLDQNHSDFLQPFDEYAVDGALPESPSIEISQPPSFVAPVSHSTRESDGVNSASQQPHFYSLNSPTTDRHLSPVEPRAEALNTKFRPLRLPSMLYQRSSTLSPSSITSSILSDHIFNSSLPQSPSVSSSTSLSHNSLQLPSPCSSSIPEHIHNTITPAHDSPSPSFASSHSPLIMFHSAKRESQSQSAPLRHAASWRLLHNRAGSPSITFDSVKRESQPQSAPLQHAASWRRLSHNRAGSRNFGHSLYRLPQRRSTLNLSYDDDEEDADDYDRTIRRSVSGIAPRASSIIEAPIHAIATPKPTLLFAIASDDVNQVRQVLESGEAGPNDQLGPQSALAFTLTNDKLSHKNEIVKTLLAYGADPSALRNPDYNPCAQAPSGGDQRLSQPVETTADGMDPATRYYITRADTVHTRQTSQLICRSFFRPLTRVRYDLIGQDWVLEQLFRVLSMHSQQLAVAPIVVLLCGPSGHGKSLLARRFGNLLGVPTHTVNMTTLCSTHDLWQSYSMSPYEEPSSDTLAQFLLNNEGKRCVVVLDEIEKVEDPKALYPLLMPWELGRCSLEAGKRHVDVKNVIWLGTSNIGHNLVFEYHDSRPDPSKPVTREEYGELMDLSRPHVSQCLGASLLSRVTTVLPFLPFTTEEKMAIAAEAVYSLAGNAAKTLSPQDVEAVVMKVLPNYFPSEGARSLHRAVSSQLVDLI